MVKTQLPLDSLAVYTGLVRSKDSKGLQPDFSRAQKGRQLCGQSSLWLLAA